jgi:hypothetical protein
LRRVHAVVARLPTPRDIAQGALCARRVLRRVRSFVSRMPFASSFREDPSAAVQGFPGLHSWGACFPAKTV